MKDLRFRIPIYINGEFHQFKKWGKDSYFDEFIPRKNAAQFGEEKPDEQYIGIKDADGNEIYEGDWVEIEYESLGRKRKMVGKIQYFNEKVSFGFVVDGIDMGFLFTHPNNISKKIVGNIHGK